MTWSKGDNAAVPLLQGNKKAKRKSKKFAYDTLSPTASSPTKASPTGSAASSSGSTALSSPSRPRFASEDLIVPAADHVNSVYYGVDAFSPTLVDFYTIDQKRIVWSSRAHRKMMTTLHRAWHAQQWKLRSLSYWAGVSGSVGYTLLLMGFMGEILAHDNMPDHVHLFVDGPLLAGALCLLASHVLSYLEVVNSCHNLELWLQEYFHGFEPVLERRFFGFFPSRIDFWNATFGVTGALFYVLARSVLLVRGDVGENFGIISVSRTDGSLILGYWVPFFVGSFLLLLSAYLAHVEVVHRWFSWRLDRLETWVTGASILVMKVGKRKIN
jgi:hypothetical protein